MNGQVTILEECVVVQEGELALPGRHTVCLVGGQPARLVTAQGQEGPIASTRYPLPQTALDNIVLQAAQILVERPDIVGFAAVDAQGAVRGVIPAARLRRLIVDAMQAREMVAESEVTAKLAQELGLEETAAAQVLGTLVRLRGSFDYDAPVGDQSLPPVTVYVCPAEAGCPSMFIPQQDGAPIPECSKHHCPLVPKRLGG